MRRLQVVGMLIAFLALLLNLQLALMKAEPAFERLSKQVQALASGLEANANIPMIRDQLDLIPLATQFQVDGAGDLRV